jgi:predicted protein tyrosine phosphatase
MHIKLAPPLEQAAARDSIPKFLDEPDRQIFVVHGLAGTDRSTLLASIGHALSEAHIGALSGRAAHIALMTACKPGGGQ